MAKSDMAKSDTAQPDTVQPDTTQAEPWHDLRRFTAARLALGRSGVSVPTRALLGFETAHALARDAVHDPLDVDALAARLAGFGRPILRVHSAAADRQQFLLRPDLGRRLDDASQDRLRDWARASAAAGASAVAATAAAPAAATAAADCNPPAASAARPVPPPLPSPAGDPAAQTLLLLIGDGLSARAIERHAEPLVEQLIAQTPPGWRIGPLVIAQQCRVALGDPVGELLRAPVIAVLIGERPGLSSPDSLGIYLTWAPRTGCNDAQRNCISNVRPEGLDYASAAWKLWWLCSAARALGATGVSLKDASGTPPALKTRASPSA